MPARRNKRPEGWDELRKYGQQIEGTRFVVFKTPLQWTSWNLNTVRRKLPEMFSIIDLTMTDRYYSHQDCVNLGLQHRKIPLRGQGSLPSEEEVEQFYETVGEFLDAQDDGLVGVHSTGYKRPGLLICRYMIEMLEFDPEEAVQAYNDASGYNIDQESYLTYLHTRAWEVDN